PVLSRLRGVAREELQEGIPRRRRAPRRADPVQQRRGRGRPAAHRERAAVRAAARRWSRACRCSRARGRQAVMPALDARSEKNIMTTTRMVRGGLASVALLAAACGGPPPATPAEKGPAAVA